MKLRMNRRAMVGSLLGSTPYTLVRSPAGVLLQSLLSSALAETAWGQSANPRRLLDIRSDGAPPRWMFDLFLTPYSDGSSFQKSAQLGTRFVPTGGAAFEEVSYQTRELSGVNAPWLWQFNVPKADGSMRPMRELLLSMLHIRGIDTNTPSHIASAANYFSPLGTVQSVPALTADAAAVPLASVNSAVSGFIFRSLRNNTSSTVAGQNLLRELLAPFLSQSGPKFSSLKKDIDAYLVDMRDDLRATAEENHLGQALSSKSLTNARELILSGFGNIDAEWAALLDKYRSLVTRSFDMSYEMAGINNRPIGSAPASRGVNYRVGSTIIRNPDLRSMITSSCSVENLAEMFALAEYTFLNNLSYSMTLGVGRVTGLTEINGAATSRFTASLDEHTTGAMPSLLINTYRSRAIAACLLELIDQLKAKSLYTRTIINVGSEFNRSPRSDGGGSDHGYQGASLALYSGAIKGPEVIGNVLVNAPFATHAGSWGYGAANPLLTGGQSLDYGYIAATLAFMLGVPSPLSSRIPLVSLSGPGFVSAIGKGQEVA